MSMFDKSLKAGMNEDYLKLSPSRKMKKEAISTLYKD